MPSRSRAKSHGFTLVEVLVVIVILGLFAAAVSIKLAPDSRQRLREEAVRLAAVLTHARDEAITTGAALAWQRTDTGYRFVRRASDRTWVTITDDPGLRARQPARERQFRRRSSSPRAKPAPSRSSSSPPRAITIHFASRSSWETTRRAVSSDGVHAPVVEDLGR